MRPFFPLLFLSVLLLAACSPASPAATLEPITVQYSFAATPWLANLYSCAGNNVIRAELRSTDGLDPTTARLVLRIGQPATLPSPSYKIGTEDILIIVNKQNPISHLTADQVRVLFNGQIQTWKDINNTNSPLTVWVFSENDDIQQEFDRAALSGAPVSSLAHLATTPDEMAEAVSADVGAIGILPRHWKAGNVADVFTVATVPVLAIVSAEQQEALGPIIACLQK
jgi:hypothetical protein